jgi:hypothetical protein
VVLEEHDPIQVDARCSNDEPDQDQDQTGTGQDRGFPRNKPNKEAGWSRRGKGGRDKRKVYRHIGK